MECPECGFDMDEWDDLEDETYTCPECGYEFEDEEPDLE